MTWKTCFVRFKKPPNAFANLQPVTNSALRNTCRANLSYTIIFLKQAITIWSSLFPVTTIVLNHFLCHSDMIEGFSFTANEATRAVYVITCMLKNWRYFKNANWYQEMSDFGFNAQQTAQILNHHVYFARSGWVTACRIIERTHIQPMCSTDSSNWQLSLFQHIQITYTPRAEQPLINIVVIMAAKKNLSKKSRRVKTDSKSG